jgi:hypothetical protein
MNPLRLHRREGASPMGGQLASAVLPFKDRQRLLRQRRRRRRWRYGLGMLSVGMAALAGMGLALVELLYGFPGT